MVVELLTYTIYWYCDLFNIVRGVSAGAHIKLFYNEADSILYVPDKATGDGILYAEAPAV